MIARIIKCLEVVDPVCDLRHRFRIGAADGRCLSIHCDGDTLNIRWGDLKIKTVTDNKCRVIEYQGIHGGSLYRVDLLFIGKVIIAIGVLISDIHGDCSFFSICDRNRICRFAQPVRRKITAVCIRDLGNCVEI